MLVLEYTYPGYCKRENRDNKALEEHGRQLDVTCEDACSSSRIARFGQAKWNEQLNAQMEEPSYYKRCDLSTTKS
jgi:hypothetical protein